MFEYGFVEFIGWASLALMMLGAVSMARGGL